MVEVPSSRSAGAAPAPGRSRRLLLAGVLIPVAAVAANIAVAVVATRVLGLTSFPPLRPTVMAGVSAVVELVAVATFAVVVRRARHPVWRFRWIVLIALLVLLARDAFVLARPGMQGMPGTSPLSVGVLVLTDVIDALAAGLLPWLAAVVDD